ncbi:MAG: kinase/pyrophosphorylase [Synergistales bacterium]|nr:kinase/pyrophosphorylase [Synergistales bacterium]
MSLKIFVVSDFTGETAEHVARAAASQFGRGATTISRYKYVNTVERMQHVLEEAVAERPVIICTLVDQQLRQEFVTKAQELELDLVDLLGPILDILESRLESPPLETPGLLRRMDEEYFRRVKAIEFAIKCDDGRSPELLSQADVIIIGVSRASKTPLSMYLAQKGFMVANIPLFPEMTPSEELFEVDPKRVIGLTIRSEKLMQIRRERLRVMGLEADISTYAQWERIEEELRYAKNIFRRIGCPVLNVTNRATEETAQEIIDVILEPAGRQSPA